MKKYSVPFTVTINGEMEIEANSREEAIELVESECLSNYCGNGGSNQLVGVYNPDISLGDSGYFEAERDCIEEVE
jgi:hypothetical protein